MFAASSRSRALCVLLACGALATRSLPARGASFEQHDARFYAIDAIEEAVETTAIVDLSSGSGLVLSDGQSILTCLHVAKVFGKRGEVWIGRGAPGERRVRIEAVAVAHDLDLALYRAREPLGPGLRVRETPVARGEEILVVGHPGGLPARASYGQIERTDLSINGVPALSYDARTDWGSSGSAVLDRQGRVVAVHWAWDDKGLWGGALLGISLRDAAARWPALAEVTALSAEVR